jgi:hopene-associated glycosyltransferase HpnB
MIALLSLLTWLYLLLGHGKFWRSAPQLAPTLPRDCPDVDIIIPARDEAQTIGAVVSSLLAQDYPGRYRIILVDDGSTDGTATVATAAAGLTAAAPPVTAVTADATASAAAVTTPITASNPSRLRVLAGQPKPPGWSGKLWALAQGVAATDSPIILFTDADIVHHARHLSTLVARLEEPRAEMVSEMVRLRCISAAERLLVPAFVYFFQLLYPFAKVNDPRSPVAAAAGGTILVRREALQSSGGIAAIKDALIDDVALAGQIKAHGAIFLGHSDLAESIRPYPTLDSLWQMIARTAFTQLRYSAVLLIVTVIGLGWVFLIPLAEMSFGQGWQAAAGAAAFAIAALSYTPTLSRYGRHPLWSLALPAIAIFYLAATVGSAINHWRGSGVHWKNRSYDAGGRGS